MKYDKELLIIRIVEIFVLFSITYIFVFYVLKKIGIIHTPLLLELSPYVLAFLSIITIAFGLFEFFTKLKNLPASHEKLVQRVDRMAFGLIRVEKDVEFLKKDVDVIKTDVKQLMRCKNYKAAS